MSLTIFAQRLSPLSRVIHQCPFSVRNDFFRVASTASRQLLIVKSAHINIINSTLYAPATGKIAGNVSLCQLYRTPLLTTNLPFRQQQFSSLFKISQRSFTGKNDWNELQDLSLMKRLKVMLKKYWYVAIPIHVVNSIVWFTCLFLLMKCGFDGSVVINIIKPYIESSVLVPDFVKQTFNKDPKQLGNLTVALLLYKLTSPARYASTVFFSIYAVKYLLRKGLLKTANQQFIDAKKSYLNHAVNKNLQKRIEKFKKYRKR